MTSAENQSFIQIGGSDTSMLRDPINEGIVWLEMTPDTLMYWMSSTDGMKVGTKEYKFDKNYIAIFDTGTSLLIIPNCKLFFFDMMV